MKQLRNEILSLIEAIHEISQCAAFHREGDAMFHSLQVFDYALPHTRDPVLLGAALLHDVGKAIDGPTHDQLFTDEPDEPELRARELGWSYTFERVCIRKGRPFREYTHWHTERALPGRGVEDKGFAVEFTIDPRSNLRERPRSSTDCKPIDRKTLATVRALVAKEHPIEWATYQSVGEIPEWSWDENDEAPGPFDGLLAEMDSDEQLAEDFIASEDERAMLDGDEEYDPLPGFEDL
jgi:hypothetical protein